MSFIRTPPRPSLRWARRATFGLLIVGLAGCSIWRQDRGPGGGLGGGPGGVGRAGEPVQVVRVINDRVTVGVEPLVITAAAGQSVEIVFRLPPNSPYAFYGPGVAIEGRIVETSPPIADPLRGEPNQLASGIKPEKYTVTLDKSQREISCVRPLVGDVPDPKRVVCKNANTMRGAVFQYTVFVRDTSKGPRETDGRLPPLDPTIMNL